MLKHKPVRRQEHPTFLLCQRETNACQMDRTPALLTLYGRPEFEAKALPPGEPHGPLDQFGINT